jgi:hypothetical protein
MGWIVLTAQAAGATEGRALPAVVGFGFGQSAPFAGELGGSGLTVHATPTMWLVTGLVPGGAAALARVPDPRSGRLRLVAVDGRSVDTLPRAELFGAFAAARERVTVTLARKRPGETDEVFLGPFELALGREARASARREVAAARARLQPGGFGHKSPERLLLEAHQARADLDAPRFRAALGALPDPEVAGEAAGLRAELHERTMAEVLRHAEAAAADGRYDLARRLIRGLQASGSWGGVRRARDAEYRAALAARKAWQAEKRRAEALRKAADAARGRSALPPPRRIKL